MQVKAIIVAVFLATAVAGYPHMEPNQPRERGFKLPSLSKAKPIKESKPIEAKPEAAKPEVAKPAEAKPATGAKAEEAKPATGSKAEEAKPTAEAGKDAATTKSSGGSSVLDKVSSGLFGVLGLSSFLGPTLSSGLGSGSDDTTDVPPDAATSVVPEASAASAASDVPLPTVTA